MITIPYEYKNNISDSGYIYIDNENFEMCGLCYEQLNPISIYPIDNIPNYRTNFRYDGDEYGVTSLTAIQFVTLAKDAFICSPDCGCNNFTCSFSYTISPNIADAWISDDIVEEVGGGNSIYNLQNIVINGTPYPNGVIWDDNSAPSQASVSVKDYIDEIINYLTSLSIPEFMGGYNLAKNGMPLNNKGDGMLELYFTPSTTVAMDIVINATPTGVFNLDPTPKVISIQITTTDTTTIDVSDTINSIQWYITDGHNIIGNNTNLNNYGGVLWTIQNCNSFNPNVGWVINEIVNTNNECSGCATGIIMPNDIAGVFGGVPFSSTSI